MVCTSIFVSLGLRGASRSRLARATPISTFRRSAWCRRKVACDAAASTMAGRSQEFRRVFFGFRPASPAPPGRQTLGRAAAGAASGSSNASATTDKRSAWTGSKCGVIRSGESLSDWRMRTRPGAIFFAISLALACAIGRFLYKPWMSIKLNGDNLIQVATFRSLDACRKDAAKSGGNWCGKGCKNYRNGSIADGKPLIPVP